LECLDIEDGRHPFSQDDQAFGPELLKRAVHVTRPFSAALSAPESRT
jgi:hypothetical protein